MASTPGVTGPLGSGIAVRPSGIWTEPWVSFGQKLPPLAVTTNESLLAGLTSAVSGGEEVTQEGGVGSLEGARPPKNALSGHGSGVDESTAGVAALAGELASRPPAIEPSSTAAARAALSERMVIPPGEM